MGLAATLGILYLASTSHAENQLPSLISWRENFQFEINPLCPLEMIFVDYLRILEFTSDF